MLNIGHTRFASFVRWTLVALGIVLAFQILSGFYALVTGSSFTDLILSLTGSLTTDEQDRTNFLILGVGGENHPGGNLTDTSLVASYSHTTETLTLLSLPRDLWLDDRSNRNGGGRINNIYLDEKKRLGDSEAALKNTVTAFSEIIDLPIHYYAKIDFGGFEKIVDALGGIKINVEKSIDDPFYPCPNQVDYCPFSITAGVHEFDGALALKYARSRETTSDFDRASRQQQIIEALREKAFTSETLTNPRKLKKIYDTIADNFETDLRVSDLIRLGKIGEKLNRQKIVSVVLNNNPSATGGFLISPDRSAYGGASVLVPETGNLKQIQTFTHILFDHPQLFTLKPSVEILNGSGKGGIAERAAYYLYRYGVNTLKANNYPGEEKFPHTTVYYYDEAKTAELRDVLKNLINADFKKGPLDLATRGYDLTVVLGQDWKSPQ